MLNLLRDHQVETEHPIGVVNWTKYADPSDYALLNMANMKQRGRREISDVHELIGRLGRRHPT